MYELFVDRLLPSALVCGVSINDFWDYDYSEILLIIKTYNQQRVLKQKETISNMYTLADLVSLSCSRLVNKDNKYPPLNELFPTLFGERRKELDCEYYKQNWKEFAERHNEKRRKGGISK